MIHESSHAKTFIVDDPVSEVHTIDGHLVRRVFAGEDRTITGESWIIPVIRIHVGTLEKVNTNCRRLGTVSKWLTCTINFLENEPLTAELPNFIDLLVTEAEPGVRGDSASNVTKFCTIETGAKIQVPLFIKEGDVLKIDSRTGKYLERTSRG